MSIEELQSFMFTGCQYQYESYDFNKAKEEYAEYLRSVKASDIIPHINHWDIPEDIKSKFRIMRIGKLRSIEFNPSGRPFRFKIGAKRARSLGVDDIGIIAKPILSKKDDRYSLIKRGLAIQKTTL